MVTSKILLTSFQTWLPHQKSNSSDDLLSIFHAENIRQSAADSYYFLRNLPVHSERAADIVQRAIATVKPQSVICCGMAESRSSLSIELQATQADRCLATKVNLNALCQGLQKTEISYDAGKFVCEGLYYRVLDYIQADNLPISGIFVHVPVLNPQNQPIIQQDFGQIVSFLQSNYPRK